MSKFKLITSLALIISGINLIPKYYNYQVPITNNYTNIYEDFAQIVAILLGLLLIVLVYQYTILKPDLFSGSVKSERVRMLLELSDFIYWFGFMFFIFFVFPIGIFLTVLLFNGFNKWSFLCMLIGTVVSLFLLDICYQKIEKYWRIHRVCEIKRDLFRLCCVLISLLFFVFFLCLPFYVQINWWNLNPFIILFIMNALLVVGTVFSLIGNLSFPFVTGLDFLRFSKEIQNFNSLIRKYRTLLDENSNCETKEVENLIEKWDLFKMDPSFRGSNINLSNFIEDIKALEISVNCLIEKQQSSQK